MNIEFWKKLREEYKDDDLEGTDAARKKRAKQTPGQETMEDCGCMNEEKKKKTPKLNKITRTPGGPKKFKVHVRDPSTGNIKTVRFGDPNMEIKRDDPERRKNFRARHNCDNPGPKTKARYWSCKQWRGGSKVEDDFKPMGELIRESLKDWFGKGGKGGKSEGGWDRYNTKGEKIGKCGDAEGYPACLSAEKAAKLGKEGRAKFVKRKRAAQREAGDPKKGSGEAGETKTSKKPTNVETGTRKKTMESRESFGRRMIREAREKGYLEEKKKPIPTDPALYARVKAETKRKFKVYPSAYANAYLVKTYKKRGGGYRMGKGD
jgi:hypothetical protein